MRYRVIAIEREYASGGREIGEKLAEKLGIPCYRQEILEQAAQKLNLPPKQLLDAEENMTGSLLFGLIAFANAASGTETDFLTVEQKLAIAEADVIRDLALSPCVIIGRGASAVLKDQGNVLRVFVHADYEARIDRAVHLYGIDPNQAESVLRRFDKRRSNYFKAATNIGWKDEKIYHLFLNSNQLGIDTVTDILYTTCLSDINQP